MWLKHSQHYWSHKSHKVNDLIGIFNGAFTTQYDTILVAGGAEPFYRAIGPGNIFHHQLIFREDYFSSALHEVAHWCIAGASRRKQDDFGYWYHAEGRSENQQNAFYDVEVKPQALEAMFSMAAGCRFSLSVDNLDHSPGDLHAFKNRVEEQLAFYFNYGSVPCRARVFICALIAFYQPFMRYESC